MPREYIPMPETLGDQVRVHAMVPRQLKEKFANAFPYQGAYQFAIRLVLETLPELIDRDTVMQQVFLAELRHMFATDRAKWNGAAYKSNDPLQLDIPLGQDINDEEE